MAGPAREAWCATTCASRNEAWSQLKTANRCRMTPANAWVAPSPSRTSVQSARARLSCSTIPSWIARPIANGISAWRDHPEDPEEDPGGERAELVPADPEEQAGGRSRVRHARVVRGQTDSAAVEPAARGVHSYGIALVHGFERDSVPP